ncbi:MAG TPA: POTRA domain-containing protein, partial [Spirochaetota bacterium]|nr:POTRA domain-containing protein [Spirochaetota bacterium]
MKYSDRTQDESIYSSVISRVRSGYPRTITALRTIIIAIVLTSLSAVWINAQKRDSVITGIQLTGLKHTHESVITRLILNRVGNPYNENLWALEKNRLMDLDLFASVSLNVDETTDGIILTYEFVELPSFLPFPAMKRTDQDGLLMGPGVVFMNMFGLGIHEELMYRTTVAPHPFKAKEALSWTRLRTESG